MNRLNAANSDSPSAESPAISLINSMELYCKNVEPLTLLIIVIDPCYNGLLVF